MADVQTTDINTKPTVTAIDSNDQIYISDGGTALKKISYTNLAKAIIEQYNASQLAGATKTIQAAFNELNSKINNPSITTIEDLNTYLNNLPSAGRGIIMVNGTVTNALIERNASAIATVAKMDNSTADMSLYSLGGNYIGIIRYNFSTSTITKKIEAAQKSDVDALNSKLSLVGVNSVGSWSNGTTANISIVVGSKTFVISVAADGTLSGNVINS